MNPAANSLLGAFVPMRQFVPARTGRRRTFLSTRDADAYDGGVRDFHAGLPEPQPMSPAASGWRDARLLAQEQA